MCQNASLPAVGALTIIGGLYACHVLHERAGFRFDPGRSGVDGGVAPSIAVGRGSGRFSGRARRCGWWIRSRGGLAGQCAGAGVCGPGAGSGRVLPAPGVAGVGSGPADYPAAVATGHCWRRMRRACVLSSILGAGTAGGGAPTRLAEPVAACLARTRSGSGDVFERCGAPDSGATINGSAAAFAGRRRIIRKLDSR